MKHFKLNSPQFKKLLVAFLTTIAGVSLTGCTTTILDKHRAAITAEPGRVHYATAVPFGQPLNMGPSTKEGAYLKACIHYHSNPSYQREAKWPYDWFTGYGGGSQQEIESYVVKECEKKYNRTCIVILYNNTERCVSTFEEAHAREQLRHKEHKDRIALAAEENRRAKAEQDRRAAVAAESLRENTCKSFGFKPGTEFFSSCLFEIYKMERQALQNEALVAERKAQNRFQEAAQLEALSIQRQIAEDQRFSQGMQLLQDAARIVNPPRTTTTCQWNAIAKTMTCN